MTDLCPRQVVERFYELYDDGTPDSYGSDRFTDLWADDIVTDYGASKQLSGPMVVSNDEEEV